MSGESFADALSRLFPGTQSSRNGHQDVLTEFWRAGLNRDSYPGTDSSICGAMPCSAEPAWRFMIGDLSEHIARVCYCSPHAIVVATTPLTCTECGRSMRVDAREKMG